MRCDRLEQIAESAQVEVFVVLDPHEPNEWQGDRNETKQCRQHGAKRLQDTVVVEPYAKDLANDEEPN
jgi:hypothetical protein